jgi:putative transposase
MPTMLPSPPHRKTIKHYDDHSQPRELTFSCIHHRPLLSNPTWCRWLSRSIDQASGRHGFDLAAFVYMPDHVHLVVVPTQAAILVKRLLFAIKRPFSFRVKQDLEQTDPALLGSLTVQTGPDAGLFHFWQQGPGYDRNILSKEAFLKAVEYIHNNPVRRELCERPEQWKWSSWKHWQEVGQDTDPDLPRVTPVDFW